MVGEAGDEDLRHLPEGRVKLKRARKPLADPLKQAQPVGLALRVSPPGLGDEQHDAVDLTRSGTERHREFPDEQEAAVAPVTGERVFPGDSAQHLPGNLLDPAGLASGSSPSPPSGLPRSGAAARSRRSSLGNVFV